MSKEQLLKNILGEKKVPKNVFIHPDIFEGMVFNSLFSDDEFILMEIESKIAELVLINKQLEESKDD